MASARDCKDPADVQPMELTRARMPWFIRSQAVRKHSDIGSESGSEHTAYSAVKTHWEQKHSMTNQGKYGPFFILSNPDLKFIKITKLVYSL